MEIEVLRKKVEDNETKIAKKLAFIEKNKARIEKLSNSFEKLAGFKYEDLTSEIRQELYQKSDEKSYKIMDYYYKIGDCKCHITNSQKDIKKIQKVLDNWNAKLDAELKRDSKRHYPVLSEFLDTWEANSVAWLKDRFEFVKESYKEFRAREDAEDKANGVDFNHLSYRDYASRRHRLAGFFSSHGLAGRLFNESGYKKEKYDKLVEDFIAKDKKLKYDDLIERAEWYVGDITDMSKLEISPKGELDGIISGSKGKVEFKTIGAGGYNIQRFHYRVLAKRIE